MGLYGCQHLGLGMWSHSVGIHKQEGMVLCAHPAQRSLEEDERPNLRNKRLM